MIALVVIVHAAVTYSNLGDWYYREPVELDPPTFLFFGVFLSFTQAYFMGLLFLIAGYFVPDSYDRKGPARFLRDRAVRLGIPTLIYMLFINPAIEYYLLAFQWPEPRPPLGQAFMDYILSGAILSGSGPMWFALALLIFSAAYAAYRLLTGSRMSPKPEAALPGHLHVAGLILLIAAGAFAIRLFQPIGTDVLNMQLCYFSSYIALPDGNPSQAEQLAAPNSCLLCPELVQGRPGCGRRILAGRNDPGRDSLRRPLPHLGRTPLAERCLCPLGGVLCSGHVPRNHSHLQRAFRFSAQVDGTAR